MLSSIVFLVTFGLIFGVLQAGEVQQRIRYGDDAEDPAVLRLEQIFQDGSGNLCTATLITPQVILTAAHCFKRGSIEARVIYGCSNLRSPRCKVMKVVSHAIHPEYVEMVDGIYVGNDRKANDIAVAKLARPIPNIKPKNLPGPEQPYPPTGYVTLKGWGRTEKGKETDVLQSTTLQILDRSRLSHLVVTEEKIVLDENKGPSGIEDGDSGGPLLIGDTVIGVASSSVELTIPIFGWKKIKEIYAMYMSVQYYSDFIQRAMKKYAGR